MQADEMIRTLKTTAVAVLKRAAFVMPSTVRVATLHGQILEMRLTFACVASGSLMLATAPATAQRIVANFTGVADSERTDVADGLGEILNMIAGSLMTVWFGSDCACQLGFAVAQTVGAKDHETTLGSAAALVRLVTEEDEGIDIAVYLQDG